MAKTDLKTRTDYIWWSETRGRMKYGWTFTLVAASGGTDIDGSPSNSV